MLRQEGAPSVFMTVSCAEYQWKELVRQIMETEKKRHVNIEEVNKLSDRVRHHIISRSAIQSTCHFQKRVEKLFHLMQYENEAIFEGFKVKDYFYRIGLPRCLRKFFGLRGVDPRKLTHPSAQALLAQGHVVVHPRLAVVPMGWSWALHSLS